MVEARAIRGPLPRAWTLATVAAMGLSSVGCTMCPDPFDYSGPVPNGSSPQNDFRARSNGILPLGAAGKPWPQIVRDGGDSAVGPQVGEPTPAISDETDADALRQTMAVMGESEDEATTPEDPPETRAMAAMDATQPALQQVPVVAPPVDVPQSAVDHSAAETPAAEPTSLLPARPAAQPVTAGETPGWRARRR